MHLNFYHITCVYIQGHREGGYNDPGAHEEAHGLQESRWLQRAQQRAHRNDTEISAVRPEEFYFWRSLNFDEDLFF